MDVFKPCAVHESKGTLPIAPLSWASCGAGCEHAELPRLGQASYAPSITAYREGAAVRTFLSANELKVAGGWLYDVRRYVDIGNGLTVGAVLLGYPSDVEWAPCTHGRIAESAAVSHVGGKSYRKDFAFRTTGQALWSPAITPAAELPLLTGMGFDIELPKRRVIAGTGTIYTQAYSSEGWTVLETNAPAEHGAGEADLGIWVEPVLGGTQRLRGWKDDGAGSFTLAESVPVGTCNLALSPTFVVGLAGDTPGCFEPSTVKLWRATRENPSSDLTVSAALPIPFGQVSSSQPIRTWGDYAALQARSFAGGIVDRLLVAQLSTWKMWTIAPRAGFVWALGAFTIDEQYLYVLEQPPDAKKQFNSLDVATGIVRIPLATLAQSSMVTAVN